MACARLTQNAYGDITTHVVGPVPDNGTFMRRQFAARLSEPPAGRRRGPACRLPPFHALELWNFLASIGVAEIPADIAEDLASLARVLLSEA